jgi:hypothetical protein
VQRFAGSVCTGNGNRTPSARSDGGATWSAPVTLAGPTKPTGLANTSHGVMVGTTSPTSFVGRKAVPIYAVAKPKSGSVFDEAMYASKVKVPALAESYPLRVADEPVLSTQGDRSQPTRPLIIQ